MQPLPSTGAKYQIAKAAEDGHHPVWSPDGTLEVGRPRALFGPLSYTEYDVSPDGQRLLLTAQLDEQADQPLTILQNWTASLRE